MATLNPFPPTNNTERYLAAILEEMRATRDLVDRLLLIALEPAPDPVMAMAAREGAAWPAPKTFDTTHPVSPIRDVPAFDLTALEIAENAEPAFDMTALEIPRPSLAPQKRRRRP
jgi:hypothetical protein